jgi:hypothetical protein
MIRFDSAKFMAAMKELKQEIPEEIDRVFNWQMALWVQGVIKQVHGDPNNTLSEQKQAFDGTVEKDLNRLFQPLSAGWDIVNYKKQGERAVLSPSRKPWFIDPEHDLKNADYSVMRAIHERYRNSRGRIKYKGDNKEENGKTYITKYAVKESEFNRYKKAILSHVGKTKAAWVKVLAYFQAKSGYYAEWSPPAWITRHSGWGSSYGVASGQMAANGMTGRYFGGSNVNWIGSKDEQRTCDWLGQLRLKDMRTHAAKRLQKILLRHTPLEARFGLSAA